MSIRSLSSLRAKLTSGLLPVVYLLTVLVAVTAGFYASNAHRAANTISLPILVYPPDGASSHVESVVLMVENPSGVDRLYVQAHQPYYHLGGTALHSGPGFDPESAAEIRINGGRWIPIDDEHVRCAALEARHGCVAGGYSTIRFSVPAKNVRAGRNIIEFKYSGSKGIRSGYRVLALGFMQGGDNLQSFNPFQGGAHDPSLLRHEDYSTWGPPKGYGNASDVAAGKALWHRQGLLVENTLSGEPIRAACGSCHATDGRDLKYFNYSNEVIVARARFHGLSEKQGKQIAAYIRSLELRSDDGQTYEAPGTPWDPPYQPGPTALASRAPGEERTAGETFVEAGAWTWAAGAGLDWILEKDIEMLPYVFPERPLSEDPTPRADRFPSGALNWHHVAPEATLNMRLIPISAQLPDWNSWLPDIHPMDSQRKDYGQWKADMQELFAAASPRKIAREVDQFANRGMRWVSSAGRTRSVREMATLSGFQWRAVKTLEKLQFGGDGTGSRYEVGAAAFCDHPVKPFCEPLSWPGTSRILFDIAPHISAHTGGQTFRKAPYMYGTRALERYYSHLWYHLQVVTNPGADYRASAQNPVDWNYQRLFIRSAGTVGMRYFYSWIKTLQMQSNGYGPDGKINGNGYKHTYLKRGWSPFTTHPSWLMDVRPGGRHVYDNLSEAVRKDLFVAGLRAWWDYTSRFPASEFHVEKKRKRWKPSSFVPSLRRPKHSWHLVDRFYQGLYKSAQWIGPEGYGIIDSLAAWGAKMWPKTKGPSWEELAPDHTGAGRAPVVRITNLSDGDTFSAPIDLVVKVNAHVPKGAIKKLELLTDGKKRAKKKKKKSPYRFTWKKVPPGRHTIAVRATSKRGNRTTTTPITITVKKSQAGGEQVVQRISLKKGWNLISSRLRPKNPDIEAVLADLLPHIVLVKDESGATFVPKYQINTIGRWDPHEAYMIYMRTEATLEIRGTPLSPTAAISLETGWNLVPYWPEVPLPVEDAFAAIISDFAIVKDAAGRVYVPGWKNEIDRLNPGQGYKVFVLKDVRFTYPKESYASARHSRAPSIAASNKQ